MDIAEVGFRVDTSGLTRGQRALEDFDRAGRRVGTSAVESGGAIDRSYRSASGGIGVAAGALRGMGAVIGGIGFAKLATDAIGMARAFDTSMNDVQAKLGATTGAMTELRDMAKDLGATTAFSASEAADGMGYLAQAGLDTNEIMKAMPTTLNLAAAASMDLATAADIATNIMGGFGLSVEELPRVADVLAATSAAANTSVEEMASAMKRVGPVASGLNVSLEESAAAVGILANNGIKADEAGTGLARMFTALTNPVGEGKKALDAMNLSVEDFTRIGADGRTEFIGIADAIDILGGDTADTTDIMKVFGQEAGPKLAALIKAGGDAVRDLEGTVQSTGQAAKMAETQMQGLPGAIKGMASAWEGLNLAFTEGGASGAVEALVRAITDGLRGATGVVNDAGEAFESLRGRVNALEALSDMGVRLEGVYGVLQDVIGAVRPLVPYIGDFAIALAAVGATAGAVALVGPALAAIAAVVLSPVVIGIAAVAAGAVAIRENWDGISAWWSGLWEGLDGDVGAFAGRLTTSIGGLAADFASEAVALATSFGETLSTEIGEAVGGIDWPSAAEIAAGAARLITGFAEIALSMTNALTLGISSRISTLGSDIDWPTGAEIVAGAAALVTAFADTAVEMKDAFTAELSSGFASLDVDWPSAADVVAAASEMVIGFTELATDAVEALTDGLGDGVGGALDGVSWPTAGDVATAAADLVTGFADLAIDAVAALIDTLNDEAGIIGSAIEWPSPGEIVAGATGLVEGLVQSAAAAITAFSIEFGFRMGEWFASFEWPSSGEILSSAGGLIAAYGDLSLEIIKALADGLVGLGAAAIDGIKEGLAGTSAVVADALADAFESIPLVGGRIAEQLRKVGRDAGPGLANGIEESAEVAESAGRDMVDRVVTGMADEAGQQSPWTTTRAIGLDAGPGLALGIEAGGGVAIGAAESLAGLVVGSFEDMGDGVTAVGAVIGESLGSFDDYDDALRSVSDEAVGAGQSIQDYAASSDEAGRAVDRANDVIRDHVIEMMAAKIEAEQGAFAAEKFKHMMEGYPAPLAAAAAGMKLANEETAELARVAEESARAVAAMQEQIAGGIVDSIFDASNSREALSNLGDFAKSWLDDMIREFATKAIVALFTGDASGLIGTLNTVLGAIGGFGDAASNILGGLGRLFGGAGSAASAAGGSMAGAMDATVNAGLAAEGASGAMGGLSGALSTVTATTAGTFAAIAAVGVAMGAASLEVIDLAGEYSDQAGKAAELGGAIGLLTSGLGGALIGATAFGAAIGGIFGGDWESQETGIAIGNDGQAQNYDYQRQSGGLFSGADFQTLYSDVSVSVQNGITAVIGGMRDTFGTQMELFGVEGGQAFAQSFLVMSGHFDSIEALNAGLAESLGNWQRQSLRVMEMNGAEMAAVFADMGVTAESSTEVINAAFAETAATIELFGPLFVAAGIDLGTSLDEQAAATVRLSNAMVLAHGSVEAATGVMGLWLAEFVPATTQMDLALSSASNNIGEFNAGLDATTLAAAGITDGVVDTRAELYQLEEYLRATGQESLLLSSGFQQLMMDIMLTEDAVMSLAEQQQANRDELAAAAEDQRAASDMVIGSMADLGVTLGETEGVARSVALGFLDAIGGMEGFVAFTAEVARQSTVYQTVSASFAQLGFSLGPVGPGAIAVSDSLVTLAGGLNEFTRLSNSYYQNFYTEEERKNATLAQSAVAVRDYNATLDEAILVQAGVTDGVVDTIDEHRAYMDVLHQNAEANGEAIIAGYAVGDSMVAVAESGQSLDGVLASLPEAMVTSAESMVTASEANAAALESVGSTLDEAAQTFLIAAQIIAEAAGVTDEALLSSSAQFAAFALGASEATTIIGVSTDNLIDHYTTAAASIAATAEPVKTLSIRATGLRSAAEEGGTALLTLSGDLRANVDKWTATLREGMGKMQVDTATGSEAVRAALAERLTAMAVDATTQGEAVRANMFQRLAVMVTESTGHVTALQTGVGAAFQQAATTAVGHATTLQTGVSAQMLTAANNASGSATAIQGFISGSMQTAANDASAAGNTIVGAMGGAKAAMDTLSGAIDAAGNEAGSSHAPIRGIGDAATYAADSARSAAGGIKGAFDGLAGVIQASLDSIKAPTITIPDVTATVNVKTLGGGIDGSFSAGLDSVPWDGFIAELHRGEMVVPAEAAGVIRALDTSEWPGSVTPSMGASRAAPIELPFGGRPANEAGSGAVVAELRKLNARMERAEARAENAEREAMALRRVIAGNTGNTVAAVDEQTRSASLDARQQSAA